MQKPVRHKKRKNRDQKRKQKQEELQQKLDRNHMDLKSLIPTISSAKNSLLLNGGAADEDVNGELGNDSLKGEFQIEYINMDDNILAPGRHVTEFKHIFEHFTTPMGEGKPKNDHKEDKKSHDEGKDAFTKTTELHEGKKGIAGEKQMSKKQKKLMNRMKVFDLKMKIRRPDMVEAWDVTTKDPLFLMEMKMLRNSVPVPRHWSQKRRYLQYKRGIHKIPFKLPDFIDQTGISKVREQTHDKHKSLKQKMRERMQPKMGKIDIDYQVLHDAFFKNQKKPKLTVHGDLYYEGKEYEIRMRGYKPGRLSPELRHALGIPENSPPPWLINMQRYGPPPAYPNLRIPGVNAPIPETITYGFGRLFTDEKGFTVYADCHGLNKAVYQKRQNRKPYWGSVREAGEEEEEEMEEDFEEEEEEEEQPEYEGIGRSNLLQQGEEELYEEQMRLQQLRQEQQDSRVSLDDLKTGIQSLLQGSASQITTTSKMPLPPSEPRPLYEILHEVKSSINSNELYASAHGYAIPSNGVVITESSIVQAEVNIQKVVDNSGKASLTTAESEKEEEKKKKEKKDKYKVKF